MKKLAENKIDLVDALITDAVIKGYRDSCVVPVRDVADNIILISGCSPGRRAEIIGELSRRCILAGLILEFRDCATREDLQVADKRPNISIVPQTAAH